MRWPSGGRNHLCYWRSFVGKYGEKGGELLAMKHNIELILDQQKKTTELTETIKTEISDKSLARQRHEEMKRDTALEIMQLFGTLQEAALDMHNAIYSLNRIQFDLNASEERKKKTHDDYECARKQLAGRNDKALAVAADSKIGISNYYLRRRIEALKLAVHAFWGGIYGDDSKFVPLMEAVNAREEELLNSIKTELQI